MAIIGKIIITCPVCNGNKILYKDEGSAGMTCGNCNGKGKVKWGIIKEKDDPIEGEE